MNKKKIIFDRKAIKLFLKLSQSLNTETNETRILYKIIYIDFFRVVNDKRSIDRIDDRNVLIEDRNVSTGRDRSNPVKIFTKTRS